MRDDITIEYIETKFQLADIFTKALDAVTFNKFRDMLLVVSASTTRNLVVKKAKEPKGIAIKSLRRSSKEKEFIVFGF